MRIIIAGGGTGGHLFPGIAIAEAVKANVPNSSVLFVGTERGIEARVLPEKGWDLALITVSGIKTGKLIRRVKGLFSVPRAMWQSWKILRRFKPDVVIGVGGYASGPCVLVASLTRRPTAILEQNSIPGFTNKTLGKFCRKIFIAFDKTRDYFSDKKTSLIGNPIRPAIRALPPATAAPGKNLFVFGGSLGARAINHVVAKSAGELIANDYTIFHQTGKTDYEQTKALYEEANASVDCLAFVDDMAEKYQWCDVIVSRAGATTVAELELVGKPAILIPYPHAADDHQTYNAKELEERGAVVVIKQSELTTETLTAALAKISEPATYLAMAKAMAAHAKPDASTQVLQWCQDQVKT